MGLESCVGRHYDLVADRDTALGLIWQVVAQANAVPALLDRRIGFDLMNTASSPNQFLVVTRP